VRRFLEEVELIKALGPSRRSAYRGDIYQLEAPGCSSPCRTASPIWLAAATPTRLRRAAAIADGWMGSGGSSAAESRDQSR